VLVNIRARSRTCRLGVDDCKARGGINAINSPTCRDASVARTIRAKFGSVRLQNSVDITLDFLNRDGLALPAGLAQADCLPKGIELRNRTPMANLVILACGRHIIFEAARGLLELGIDNIAFQLLLIGAHGLGLAQLDQPASLWQHPRPSFHTLKMFRQVVVRIRILEFAIMLR